jgi:acetoacetate decarboxylase
MLCALDRSDVARLRRAPLAAEFTGAEMLMATFQTDPGAVARILPRPLRPANPPVAYAFVTRCPRTNLGSVYDEGALFIQARLGRDVGL